MAETAKQKPAPGDMAPPSFEEVQEAVALAWTEASNLESSELQERLCEYLANAASILDRMIEERDG